ncbi:hypothetical protein ASA_3000 [Aeromonas salmonicida subsp. salmonicida A449]|uniref:Uncharacterized protein n=1 Tax=Aeromonas salmonicida (strain A449) TaxID=382245 RepID=A4SQ29_AERS4|nr:hypothetical protein ASA_3000 [Aeromonas salmonicida subsp. salmonicida A449]
MRSPDPLFYFPPQTSHLVNRHPGNSLAQIECGSQTRVREINLAQPHSAAQQQDSAPSAGSGSVTRC